MESDLQLYSKLLELPLFQGIGKADLEEIVSHTKFGFHKYGTGKRIIMENEVCSHMHFLMDGKLCARTIAAGNSYEIAEDIFAPEILQPERLFGLTQRFTKSFITESDCNMLTLDKGEVMRLSDQYMIFRINLLNILSTGMQKHERLMLHKYPETLEERIIRFIADRCMKPAGTKIVKIKMRQLAMEINDSRLDISKALNNLEKKKQINLRRGYIDIPAIENALR